MEEVKKKKQESVELTTQIQDPSKFTLGKKPRHYKKPLKKDSAGWTHSTHTGIKLTPKEETFITEFINNGGNKIKAYEATGGIAKDKRTAADRMMKPYIQEEISYRMSLVASRGVAELNEVMQYYTGVMRGQVKDRFDFEPTVADRLQAARELAKRYEMMEKAEQKGKNIDMTIVLDWERPKEENIEKAEENLVTT